MKTAGDLLRETRLKKNIDYSTVCLELKIHEKFIRALESNDYAVFSDLVQIKGFLKNYSKFLGLNPDEILAFWRRDFNEGEPPKSSKFSVDPMLKRKLIITPTHILTTLVIASLLFFIGYLYFQYRSFAGVPYLAVESPSADISVKSSTLDVFGKVDKDCDLTLNGEKIITNGDGHFAVTVSLSRGVNNLNFVAVNVLRKESKVVRTVLLENSDISNNVSNENVLGNSISPESSASSEVRDSIGVESPENTVTLEVEIVGSASWIEVTQDGKKVVPRVVMLKGVKTVFTAYDYISLKVGNAGAVRVYLNGQDQGLVGKESEPLEKIYKR